MELTPLIDVVFLLLTFFVFSLAVMVRADVLDIRLPTLGAAENPQERRAVTVAVRADGGLTVDGEAVALEVLAARLKQIKDAEPEVRFLIAADEGGKSGDLLRVVDALAQAGLSEFSMLSKPREGPGEGPGEPAAEPSRSTEESAGGS